jgi:hypothetical protein
MIYIHKEFQLDYIQEGYPAEYYVLVDDKVRILDNKTGLGRKADHGFPRQWHYAMDQKKVAKYRQPDITLEHVGMLLNYDLPALMAAAKPA